MVAKFKLIISNPKSGKSQTVELEGSRSIPLLGKKIGEVIDGSVAGLADHNLMITGGTDKDGFPLRVDVHGGVKARVVLSGGSGFKPKIRGERKRKTVRGNIITEDTVQVNMKILDKH